MAGLKAEKISKRYGSKLLFAKLSLAIEDDASLCIWGPNGSGKSTLLKVLAGLVRPTSGKVFYTDDGREITPHAAKNIFAIAAPDIAPYDELTAVENLIFLAKMRGMDFNRDAAAALLDKFGLADAADTTAGTMSSGMKQRLRLSAAAIHPASVLLLDEPTSYLDSDGTDAVERFVSERKKSGIVVIATNNTVERSWCSEVVELGAANDSGARKRA